MEDITGILGELRMKAIILKTLAVISFVYINLYVLSLDSLTVRQLLIGGAGCIVPVLYLAAFVYANYR